MAMHRQPLTPPIDPREVQEELRKIAEYHLDVISPALKNLWDSTNTEKDKPLYLHNWRAIKDLIGQYMAYLTLVNPFIPVPRRAFPTGYTIATQKVNGEPIKVTRDQFARHTYITSASGGGKTTCNTHLLDTLLADGINALIIDAKDDYRAFATRHTDCLILTTDSPWNLLSIPPYMTKEEFIAVFVQCYTRSFYGAELSKQILHEALQQAYAEHDTPCITDLQAIVLRQQKEAKSPTRKDAVTGVYHRLERIRTYYPVPCSTRRGVTIPDLFQHSLYVPFRTMDETSEFLTTYLLHALYLHHRLQGQRDALRTIVSMDEGLLLWNKHATGIEGTPILSSIHSMVREFGIGMIVTATSVTQTDALFKSNTFLQITMNVSNSHESEAIARTYGLNDLQRQYLDTKLTRGECIIKLADTWRLPILATFPPPTHSKEVSLAEYEAAKRRINDLAPPDLPAQVTTAQAPPKEEQPATPSPAPPLNAMPAPLPTKPSAPVPKPSKPSLSANEKKLLTRICTVVEPVSIAYAALDFHPTTGNRAKQKLLALGLVEEHVLTVRRGRGGQAHILFPTPEAYTLLGLQRPKQTRGGDSPQHQYLVQTIARLLPESHIEFSLAGKAMDIYLRYTQSLHHALLDRQQEIFGRNDLSFTEGDHLALELEVSDPEKTGPANVQQNAAAGITTTIVLVLPDQLERTKKILAKNPHCIVGDALALLDNLRGSA